MRCYRQEDSRSRGVERLVVPRRDRLNPLYRKAPKAACTITLAVCDCSHTKLQPVTCLAHRHPAHYSTAPHTIPHVINSDTRNESPITLSDYCNCYTSEIEERAESGEISSQEVRRALNFSRLQRQVMWRHGHSQIGTTLHIAIPCSANQCIRRGIPVVATVIFYQSTSWLGKSR
ncbi:hypothetical protein SAMN05216562_1764 [Microbulbifer marinus]|uniref:Uncharacterized protein n=1 Tax=Microbulbifer marinus TaxID=658218 RepID=A0A1H3YJ04_9GAMM|nr:hypothetical protein SAMN05216562_1764 [Microbulbifer marinus]